MGEYIGSVKKCDMFGIHCFITRDKDGHLGECIHDGKYHVIGIQHWEFYYEVHGYRFKGEGVCVWCNGEQGWFRVGGVILL